VLAAFELLSGVLYHHSGKQCLLRLCPDYWCIDTLMIFQQAAPYFDACLDVAHLSGLFSSKADARRTAKAGGLSLNNVR
jgi:hypothetical protein